MRRRHLPDAGLTEQNPGTEAAEVELKLGRDTPRRANPLPLFTHSHSSTASRLLENLDIVL